MKTTRYTALSLNMYGTPFHPKKIVKTILRNAVRKRFSAIAAIIETLESDFLFLQEVHDFPHYFFLRKLLPTYPYAAYKKSLYGPRGGLVIFSRHPLTHSHFYDFMDKGKIYNKSITGHLSLKGILAVRLRDHDLWLFNTHLTQNSDHDWSPSNRYISLLISQLQQVIVHTASITKKGGSIILAGDLNMPKDTQYYDQFLKESRLHDSFKADSFTTYHQSFLPEGAAVGRVDYIFTSPSLRVIKKSYILKNPLRDDEGKEFYASDHIGLLASYEMTENVIL